MAETIKGINVVIGSDTTGLSAALSDVNKSSREIQGELSKVERLLKFNPKDTQLLAQKQKLLGDQVAVTREKLDRLKIAQAQVNEQFKKGDITEGQYRAFQREIIETESKLKHFETQLKNTGSSAEELGKKMQAASEKLDKTGKALTKTVSAPIAIAGAAAFKMAADIEDAFGATEQVFGSADDTVKDWARNLESYYGIAETEALEYSNMMGSMLKNIGGLTEDQAAKQSQTLIELAGDLTAMYGGTTADAVRALTGALKGNNTMLDNYGMAVNDAMVKTKAYEMGLYDGTGQMDLATKQAATLALIMEQTGAAQGQAAREAAGASGSMRALMTELKNLATTFGQILLPIITPFITRLGEMVKRLKDLDPSIKQTIVLIAGMALAIGPMLIAFAKIVTVIQTLIPVFAALNAVMTANPIGIVVVAIGALIAAGIALWKNWDKVKEVFLNVWDSIVYGVQQAISYLKTLLFGYIKMWIDSINVIGKYIPGLNKALDSAKKTVEGWIETEKNAIQYRREERKETKAQAEALKLAEAELKANQEAANNLAKAEQNLTNAQGQQVQKTKEQLEAEKKLKEDRLKFEADWNNRLLSLNEQYSLSRTQNAEEEAAVQLGILERQKQEALKKAQELGASTLAIQQYFALEEQKIIEKQAEARRAAFEAWTTQAQDVIGKLQGIFSAYYQNRIAELDNYQQAEREKIEESLLSEEEKQAKLAELEADVEKRKKEAARKQAQKDKEFAIFQTIINTAQAVVKTLASVAWPLNIAMAALVGALGAAQLSVIKSKPLPALAEGGLATKETIARIGERKDRVPEAILPLTQKVLSDIGKGIAANMPQFAGSGGDGLTLVFNVHGNIIGDKAGMRKLAQEVFSYEYSIKRRLGGAEA
jgi:cell division septum initiation protein DivIVA